MSLKKDEAFSKIREDFEGYTNLVLEQLDILESIITGGSEIPEDVLKTVEENEKKLDKKDVRLSDRIVNCIVLYHPVASELRQLMATYRIIINLERVGDHVWNLVHFIRDIKKPEVYEKLQEVIYNMVTQSVKMVQNSTMSFMTEEKDLAVWTIRNSKVFHEMNHKLLKKLISAAKSEESNKKLLISIITIRDMMSNIERIADHAANIAEDSIYYLEGRDIRHQKIEE